MNVCLTLLDSDDIGLQSLEDHEGSYTLNSRTVTQSTPDSILKAPHHLMRSRGILTSTALGGMMGCKRAVVLVSFHCHT